MTQPLLNVSDLCVHFRTEDGLIRAVNDVSFKLQAGQTLALVGESGSGKSVTGLAIIGLLSKRAKKLSSGSIEFDGRELTALSERQMRAIRGQEIAMVFQDPMTSLNPVLTIGKQMAEVLTAHQKISWRDALVRCKELLGMVGMPRPESTLTSYPHQLSGGMRQRVMIATALALKPRLLIADEPTTALDVTIQAQVFELLRELIRLSHTALILVSHDLGAVASMAEHVNIMYAGSIVESAPTTELFAKPSHPYTIGLLNSAPRLDLKREKLVPIDGSPPDPYGRPPGCAFAPRCNRVLSRCRANVPVLTPVAGRSTGSGEDHWVACFNQPGC